MQELLAFLFLFSPISKIHLTVTKTHFIPQVISLAFCQAACGVRENSLAMPPRKVIIVGLSHNHLTLPHIFIILEPFPGFRSYVL